MNAFENRLYPITTFKSKATSVGRLGPGRVRIDEPISLAHPQNATITYLIREKGTETSEFVLVRLTAVFRRL